MLLFLDERTDEQRGGLTRDVVTVKLDSTSCGYAGEVFLEEIQVDVELWY